MTAKKIFLYLLILLDFSHTHLILLFAFKRPTFILFANIYVKSANDKLVTSHVVTLSHLA